MKVCRVIFFFCVSTLFLLTSCKDKTSGIPEIDHKIFNAYWDQGKKEISNYTLNQSINGAAHDGSVILVFTTEDMSKSKQVRLEDPVRNASDVVKVLRLTTAKEFVTGIDKNTMMSSVFTPIDYLTHPHSLKLTVGRQDLSGQSFTQFNWRGNRYDVQQFSNLESEGDQTLQIVTTWLEDEIWTKIRVAPNTLPIGDVSMIPGALYIRLNHQELKSYDAIATLKTEGDQYNYTIHYPGIKRTLEIKFEKLFPYKIISWAETNATNEVINARLSVPEGELNSSHKFY